MEIFRVLTYTTCKLQSACSLERGSHMGFSIPHPLTVLNCYFNKIKCNSGSEVWGTWGQVGLARINKIWGCLQTLGILSILPIFSQEMSVKPIVENYTNSKTVEQKAMFTLYKVTVKLMFTLYNLHEFLNMSFTVTL